MPKIERLTVRATYVATKDGQEAAGLVEFVARVADSSKGYNLEERAKRAASRRTGLPAPSIRITGGMSF